MVYQSQKSMKLWLFSLLQIYQFAYTKPYISKTFLFAKALEVAIVKSVLTFNTQGWFKFPVMSLFQFCLAPEAKFQ